MLVRFLFIIVIISITGIYAVYKKNSLESRLVTDSKSESVLAKMPSASFETLDGTTYDLDSVFLSERIGLLIIHYWGTWCGPCEAELPDLLRFIKQFEGKSDVKFLLVAANDEVMKIKKHLATLEVKTTANVVWLIDNKNVHRELFGTIRVPETYVFSSSKATLRKFVGPQEWTKPVYSQTFDELLQISTRQM